MNTPHNRPEVVNQVASQIIPAALLVFKGLKRAYQSKIFSAFIIYNFHAIQKHQPNVLGPILYYQYNGKYAE